MKVEEQKFMLDVAKLAAERSSGVRLKVGAVVTDSKGNIVTTGYNGTIRGFHTNVLEDEIYESDETNLGNEYPYTNVANNKRYRLVTDESRTIHAENNLIAHAARRGVSIDGGTVFVTVSPCAKCTAMLIQSGIVEVVYMDEHRTFSDVKSLYGNYIKLTHFRNIR